MNHHLFILNFNMKKLLIKISILFTPLLCLLITVNYNIDPGGKFSNKNFYQKVASALAKGKNIVITERMHNFLGSPFLYHLISNQKAASSIAVIGSSRVMPMTAEMIGDRNFMNYSAHGINFGDYIGIYELLYRKNLLPKKLIIDLSQILLIDNPVPNKAIFMEGYNMFISRKITNNENNVTVKKTSNDFLDNLNEYLELLSPKYFQQSIKYLIAGNKDFEENNFELTYTNNTAAQDENIIPYDNSRYKKINTEIDEIQKIYDSQATVSMFSEKRIINPKTTFLLIKLIEDIKAQNIEVIFILLPFDPYFYDAEVKALGNDNFLTKTDEYFFSLKEQMGDQLMLVGSTNPFEWGISREDAKKYFFDFSHLTSFGMRELLSKNSLFDKGK
jgi:hypothetical protein